MKVLTWLVTALLVCAVVFAALCIPWLIWRVVAQRSWYFFNMTTWQGRLGRHYVRAFYKRYGLTEATELLVQHVTAQLAKMSAMLAVGVEAKQLEKALCSLDMFMSNVIAGLRALHLEDKAFPILATVFALFYRAQAHNLQQSTVLHEAGFVLGSTPSITVDNPFVPRLTWILKELGEGKDYQEHLQDILSMLRRLGRSDPKHGAFFTGLADSLERANRDEPGSGVRQ